MKYGSVCSGVEAATLAWESLGWEPVFFSEVEHFPCAVLQHRFGATAPINMLDPADASNEKDRKLWTSWKKANEKLNKEGKIPNEGDFTKIGTKYAGKIDLLVGGTPCQDCSIAGKREGFAGERSGLAIDFVRLAYESKCKWFVWENVPGCLSSGAVPGGDFATLLSLFSGCKIEVPEQGWGSVGFVCNARRDRFGLAWRILDVQFTRTPGFPNAIPQRRRRVFLVGYFGDWTRAAEVLFEQGRVSWDTPARIKTRERVAGTLGNNSKMASGEFHGACGCSERFDCSWDPSGVNPTLMQSSAGSSIPGASNQELFSQNCNGLVTSIGNGQVDALINESELAQTLNCMHDQQAIQIITPRSDDVSGTIDSNYFKGVGSRMGEERTIICRATQQGNAETMLNLCPTITQASGTSGNNQPIICLNDQGGSVISVESNGNAGTLRANTHGNEQIVCAPAESVVHTLKIRGGKEGGGKGALIQDNISATLGCGNDQTLFISKAPERIVTLDKQLGFDDGNIASALLSTDYKEPKVVCYENHANDSRVQEMGDACQTISSRAGTGGGNLPLVQCFEWHSQDLRAKLITDNCGTTISVGMGMGGASNTTPMLVRECYVKTARPKFNGDCETYVDTGVSATLNTFDVGDKRSNELIISCGFDGYNESLTFDASATLGVNCGMSTGRNGVITATSINCQGGSAMNFVSENTDTITAATNSSGNNLFGVCSAVAIAENIIGRTVWNGGNGVGAQEEIAYTKNATGVMGVAQRQTEQKIASTVRRLLPIETERLMGFPDNHTRIPWNGKDEKDCPDAARYKACGNSMGVNVMEWIGMRIQMIEDKYKENRK